MMTLQDHVVECVACCASPSLADEDDRPSCLVDTILVVVLKLLTTDIKKYCNVHILQGIN